MEGSKSRKSKWGGVYWYLVVDPTHSIDTGEVIYIHYAYEY